MNSRATSAASSRRVKQELVRLLFGQEATSATSRHACRSKTLDHSIYSYADLRSAYLEKLQKWHPDKQYAAKDSHQQGSSSYASRHSLFVELQEAWDRYDEMAKISQRVDSDGVDKERNFTMFGVGCSFSDNDAERELRTEIMDQAGRGWFSGGSLASSSSTGKNSQPASGSTKPSLLDDDDDMFVTIDETSSNNSTLPTQQPTRKRSLVDRKFRPRSVVG